MTTEAQCTPEAPGSRPGLHADQRGAIMVLGIFMCTCMVGALWYLAGIGDAIIYRERMQEGADAAAFSAAALHARGMNIIVLLNMIMALILAIRVALKAIYLASKIIATLLKLIPYVGAALSIPFEAIATGADITVNALKPVINSVIPILSQAQGVIARIVPPAALWGAENVARKYSPIVNHALAGSPTAIAQGLPVENDTPDHLCEKATDAVVDIFEGIVDFPVLGSGLGGAIRAMARLGGSYFCEIGGASVPDMNSGIGDASSGTCDTQREELQKELDTRQQAYQTKCDEFECDKQGVTLTPDQEAELAPLAAARDAAQSAVDSFDPDRCRRDNGNAANDVVQSEMGKSSGGGGSGMNPKRIRIPGPGETPWRNGIKDAQIVAVAEGNTDSLKVGPRGAKIGAWRTAIDSTDPPLEANFAIAQAEYFFDCGGAWTDASCNGQPAQSNSMWSLRWRARLRRYNDPFTGGGPVTDFLTAGGWALRAGQALPDVALTLQNTAVLNDLRKAALQTNLIIH